MSRGVAFASTKTFIYWKHQELLTCRPPQGITNDSFLLTKATSPDSVMPGDKKIPFEQALRIRSL